MALGAVELTNLGLFDRWGYQKAVCIPAADGGTDVWTRIDASQDETYENRVKGTNATATDAAFLAMVFGQFTSLQSLLTDLSTYTATDRDLGNLNAYFASFNLRIDERSAQIITERFGSGSVLAAQIHGKADAGASAPGLVLGDLLGDDTFTAGTSLDLTAVSESAILARVTVLGSADWNITVDGLQSDEVTPTTIAQVITGTGTTGAVGDTYVIGAEAIGGAGAASGQAVIPMAATGAFIAGEKVLVTQWTGSEPNEIWVSQEWATILSLVTDTSITLTTDLLHTYTSAGFVYPLFAGVDDAVDSSGGAASDRVYFYPAPDRRLKL